MKKTITVKSIAEAQKLLCSGEVKEITAANGVAYVYDPKEGIQTVNHEWLCGYMGPPPYTYEIDVPETREETIERLAPGFEECSRYEANDTYNDSYTRYGLYKKEDELTFCCDSLGHWSGGSKGEYIWLRKKIDRSKFPTWENLKIGDRFVTKNKDIFQITKIGDQEFIARTLTLGIAFYFSKNRWSHNDVIEFDPAPEVSSGFVCSARPGETNMSKQALAYGVYGIELNRINTAPEVIYKQKWRWIVPVKLRVVDESEIAEVITITLDGEPQTVSPYKAFRMGVRWREGVE